MKRTAGYNLKTKKSLSPAKPSHQSPGPANNLTNSLYYCHYRNAMYMGPVKNFKKDGRGILLHDNGMTLLCQHTSDLLHGHNLIFSQHCLVSAQFNKGKLVDAVYRTDGFLAHFLFNNQQQLHGKCKLLNFINKSLTYAVFRKGILVQKSQEAQFTLVNRIFDLGEFQVIIGRTHHRAVNYQIDKEGNIEGQKHGNKLSVGFSKGGAFNGLGFHVIFRNSHGGYNPDTHRNEDMFQLKIVERGYMQNGQLNGFGQKLFQNGNLYIGQFKNSIFEGNGVLYNRSKRNWVNGFFQNGNLTDLFHYNNEGGDKKYDRIIESMHQRKSNWINYQVNLPPLNLFDQLIQKTLADVPSAAIKSLQQRKQDVLKRIQENFICQESGILPSFLKDYQNGQFQKTQRKKETVKHFVHSFIPQSLDQKQDQNAEDNKASNSKAATKFTPSRKIGQDIRKSKIFDKSQSTDRYLKMQDISASRSRSARTPEQKKKIFNQTAATTSQKIKTKLAPLDTNSPEVDNFRREQTLAHKISEDYAQASSALHVSEDDISSSPEQHSRLKKSTRRSRIFKQKQQNAESYSSPKFIYTKVDSIPEAQRRKRIGLQDNM